MEKDANPSHFAAWHVVNGHMSTKVTDSVNNGHSIPVVGVSKVTLSQERYRVTIWREHRVGASPFEAFYVDDLRSWS